MKTEQSAVQTLDQRRAAHAWEAIQRVKVNPEKPDREEYAGEAKKLPIRIMTSGLGQALAFLLAKARDKKKTLGQLHEDLTDWALRQRGLKGVANDSLIRSVIEGDSIFLRQVTDEVLAYLQWLNRFAEAEGLKSDQAE
ncbi:MAG: type III-B CRISPR module-associated protein Cmr5 [Pirellulales bacterium]|jgi:CRISPR-associated protein Cmr5|nr:type III-B CRISPR module-associated protein Cmr5 [Thermoguttaceae bacterium]MDD4787285.1 type III-B CRISPR module-associated protein Cmr5 [Pirellulales bacterium]NLZ01088.1 type III-B CRISPR module-associated protein Cmr5 [Pirellulaceae bacterium]